MEETSLLGQIFSLTGILDDKNRKEQQNWALNSA